MKSIWTEGAALPQFPAVRTDMKVDVLIIGGGMAGLLCGYFLKEQGAKYAVVEKNRICSGVTGHTTAKITAHHGLIYSRLLKESGRETAAAYYQAASAAIAEYRQLAQTIDCDFEEKDNYIYSMTDKGAVLDEISAIEAIGGKSIYVDRIDIPLPAMCAVKSQGQAQFHPLKFAAAIAGGQSIYEGSFAGEIRKERYGYRVSVLNDLGQDVKINADRVIAATHFPYLDRWGMYFLKMYQQRSYVLSLTAASPQGSGAGMDGMYIGCGIEEGNPLNLSFRRYGDLILLGGGGGRTGAKHPGFSALREEAARLYPGCREAAAWAAQDCMTLDGAPYIGPYAKGKDGLLAAAGFNKWGMTGAMTAAMALTGKLNRDLARAFSPQRSMLRKQLFVNGFESAKNMLRPTAPRCTHLGCALKWNPAEKTWDCGCHGSRFAADGGVIDGPAQNELKKTRRRSKR